MPLNALVFGCFWPRIFDREQQQQQQQQRRVLMYLCVACACDLGAGGPCVNICRITGRETPTVKIFKPRKIVEILMPT